MCVNCGCRMPADDMGNPDNLTTAVLAKAALAGNDGNASDFLTKVKQGFEDLSVEDLQAEIDHQKGK